MENQEKEMVSEGKFVTYSYKLYNAKDHSLLFETPEKAPDCAVIGHTAGMVPGLEAAMIGLSVGDKFEVELPPVAAFGDKNPDLEMELDKAIFMKDGKLAAEVKVGESLPMMTAEGFRVQGTVLYISEDKVKMDFNHPFAGLTVIYEGEIDSIRDATPEELSGSGCGGCCGGGGCGSNGCDSGSCGCESKPE